MKMVTDSMPHHSISVNNLESNSVQNALDDEQSKGDLKIFPEDLHESKCNNKYVDSLPVVMNNGFIIMESPGQDCCADVKETQIDAGFDILVEHSAMCHSKTRADEDNIVQSSAGASVMEFETDGSAIKDICIDEGVPVKDKILVEDVLEEGLKLKHIIEDIYPTKDEEFGSKNEKVKTEWPVPVGLKSSADEACEKNFNSCESKVLLHQSESKSEVTGLVLSDLPKEKVVDTLFIENTYADESLFESSMENGCKDEQDTGHKDSETECEVALGEWICSSSTPESSVEETTDYSKVKISDMKTEPAPEATNESSFSTAVNNNEVELHNHPRERDPLYLASDHFTPSAPLQRDHFESSFASVGHYTGSISYSGPIAHSGSLSHRSDASTVSTRSFAFPLLQNEWNFSPVRMQKADRRRRHRGWMHGLFCCKF